MYNKEQLNPFTKKWEKTGVATLLEHEAEILNDNSKATGIRYVKGKAKK